MRKVKTANVGLLCGVLCFGAGIVFTSFGLQATLSAGLVLLVAYYPIRDYHQRSRTQMAEQTQKVPGLAEYGTILIVVAVLMSIVFAITKQSLDSAVSSYLSYPAKFN
ncbi:MAG: hypothetical protein SGJ27_21915 [Candidatus Melainabacteria bacterium]|nr:hypothetical protein [Candidatus Melainabacteria bacterium]